MKIEEAIYCLKSQSERYSEVCEECPLYGQTGVDHCCEDALQMAITALQNQPVWIPVSDRLPEKNKKVIIFTKTENLYIGTYCQNIDKTQDGVFLIRDNIYMQIDRIAAWMPLPEPYRENEEENGK